MSKMNQADVRNNLELYSEHKSELGFNPLDDVWTIRGHLGTSTLDFKKIRGYACKHFINCLKLVFISIVEEYSRSSTTSFYKILCASMKPDDNLKELSHDNFAYLKRNFKTTYMRKFMDVVKIWDSLGVPGLSDGLVAIANEYKAQKIIHYKSVMTHDPYTGPLTLDELSQVIKKSNQLFSDGELTFREFVMLNLSIATGIRAKQFALLKLSDFYMKSNGQDEYYLKIPYMKAKGSGSRERFYDVKINTKLSFLIQAWVKHTSKWFVDNISTNITEKEIPFFPISRKPFKDVLLEGHFEYHSAPNSIAISMRFISNKLNIISERTGEQLALTCHRFRRTLGTLLALKGYSPFVIGEALGHKAISAVMYYVKANEDIINSMGKKMESALKPLADHFCGDPITDLSQLPHTSEKYKYVDSLDGTQNQGLCYENIPCLARAPIACYDCKQFVPFKDGPHEEILDELLKIRTKMLAAPERYGPDLAHSHDLLIRSVITVIEKCKSL